MRIDVDAVLDVGGVYRMVVTTPHCVGQAEASVSRLGAAREAALGAARLRWEHPGIVGIGRFRLARPAVGPDGQFVRRADGEVGTASWVGPEWAWLVTTRGDVGMSATEGLLFGFEPGPDERAELEAWLELRRRQAEDRWRAGGQAVLEVEALGFAARIVEVARQSPGRALRVGLAPLVADAVDDRWLERLSPDGVPLSVFPVSEARAWDVIVVPV